MAHPLTRHIVSVYTAAADPGRAPAMEAYMKDRFRFFGLPTPERRRLSRPVLNEHPLTRVPELDLVVRELWALEQRELQYLAVEVVERHPDLWTLETCRFMIVTKSWWDTVDAIASHVVGGLVRRQPGLGAVMDRWVESDEMWLQRAAVLHQLGYRERTDAERLFRYCLLLADRREFFLRKALGWALRQYSYTAPGAVARFVDEHRGSLSPLTGKEALKAILRRGSG